MSATIAPPALTPDDLLRMPDDGHSYEFVNGELQEVPVSRESARIASELYFSMRTFTVANPLGWVFADGVTYRCFADDPRRVRKPDTSFITLTRLPLEGYQDEGHTTVVPDLVAEVISPNDIAENVEVKLQEWLTAGVRVVLIVSTHTRTIRIHHADCRVEYLRAADTLTLPDLLPGFAVPVASLFRRPGEPVPTS